MVTKINDFPTNRQEADEKARRFLPVLYERLTNHGYYRFFDFDDKEGRVMQARGVDAEHDSYKNSRREWDEHKIVQWPEDNEPYDHICAETWSCTLPKKWKEGWMYTSFADNLFYGFEIPIFSIPILDVLIIYDFQGVKRMFWLQDLSRYNADTQKGKNRTRSVLVPISDIAQWSPNMKRILLTEKGSILIPSEHLLTSILTIKGHVVKYQKTGECSQGYEFITALDKLLLLSATDDDNSGREVPFEQLPIW